MNKFKKLLFLIPLALLLMGVSSYHPGGNGIQDSIEFRNSANTFGATFVQPTLTADRLYTLPDSDITLGAGLSNIVEDLTPQLGAPLLTNAFQINESKGADVISATALPVLADGNSYDVTGTTTITSINTMGVGTVITLQFDAALTITHAAADLVLPNDENILTVAGDIAVFYEYATGDWRLISYTRNEAGVVNRRKITSGSTSLAFDADVILATFLVTDGWCPQPFVSIQDDVVFFLTPGDTTNAPPTDVMSWMLKKTAVANQYTLNARQQDGGSGAQNIAFGVWEER